MPALNPSPRHDGIRSASRSQRGAASLVVVLMLFFVIALVAAYTSRNLIFEQRTSINQYRSTMAFEAAEAGIQWAVGLLNGGRIGNDCAEAGAPAGAPSFRQRYLNIDDATGMITPRMQVTNPLLELKPSCVWTGAAWACNCPTDANPALAAQAAPGLHPAFRVRFIQTTGREGVIRLQVNACVRMDEACLDDFSATPQDSEGRAQHTTLLALKSALTTPPGAALTVVGAVAGGGAAVLENSADTLTSGVTLQAAGAANTGTFTLTSLPGTPGSRSVVAADTSLVPNGLNLADLQALPADPAKWDRVFGAFFGLLPTSYQQQPAAVTLACAAAGCRQGLSDLVAANPNRVIWIPGDLTLETAGDVGSLPNAVNAAVAGPATLIVGGRLRFTTPGVRIFGLVYTRDGNWEGSGTITGAAITEGDLAAAAAPTVVYNQPVINAIWHSSGSFVQLTGDWKDFK